MSRRPRTALRGLPAMPRPPAQVRAGVSEVQGDEAMTHDRRPRLPRWRLPFPWWALLAAAAVGGFVLYVLAEVATRTALHGPP